jgi:hypothetical protein
MAGTVTGYGISITFSTGFFAKILNVDGPNMKRANIDTTYAVVTGGWMTFQPSDLKDPGEITVDIIFTPNTTPPLTSAAETITITYPIQPGGSTAATWSCSGYLADFKPKSPIGDKMTANCTLKWTGQPTFTPGS